MGLGYWEQWSEDELGDILGSAHQMPADFDGDDAKNDAADCLHEQCITADDVNNHKLISSLRTSSSAPDYYDLYCLSRKDFL